MSIWVLIVLATAAGGALLIWHTVSQTKHLSEEMLRKYTDMLREAREKKARMQADGGSAAKDAPPPPAG